jgi:PepSY-associated TM region
MRALTLLHRWLGVVFCLFFAMWFATGIVMHFVPFPRLTEAERFAGLAPLDLERVRHGPAEAVRASGMTDPTRVRLLERSDGPLYVVSGRSTVAALRADNLAPGRVASARLAAAITADHARRRGIDGAGSSAVQPIQYDQWTLAADFDAYRPLYRVALDDSHGTTVYLSSATGEVVLDTARRERVWNYLGSVAHWIYPTVLRSRPAVWSLLVSWLAFLAFLGAAIGALLGALQLTVVAWRPASPHRGAKAWHHWFGLICAPLVLSWIFSGWLSMDQGRLFSTGEPSAAERAAVTGVPDWDSLGTNEVERIAGHVLEVEWFAFGGRMFRRERIALDRQRLFFAGTRADAATPDRASLQADEIAAATRRLGSACQAPAAVDPSDAYAPVPTMPDAPLVRVVCGDDWFYLDAASGELLEKADASRRAYRWLFRGLHTLDFPALTDRPTFRSTLIVALCICGLAFSFTGVVIGWRRSLSILRAPQRRKAAAP